MKNSLLIAACLFVLAGCEDKAPWPDIPVTTPFDDRAFAPYAQTGTAFLQGHATLMRGSKEIGCWYVNLLPATAYVDNMIQVWRQGGHTDEIKGLYADQAIRKEKCEANGAFSFVNLPAGKWYIEAAVFTSPLFYGESHSTDTWGGILVQTVETIPGQEESVTLNEKDLINRNGMSKK